MRTGITAVPARRVALLVTSSARGGAERVVHDLAITLHDRGWEVGCISMLPVGSQFEDLGDRGIEVASLDMRQGVPDPRALVRLAAILRDWRPDVLHGHMVHANLLARLSRLLVRTRVVVSTMHNFDEGGRLRYLAYRITDPLTNTTTAVSTAAVEEAVRRRAVPRDKILFVPNGVDVEAYELNDTEREAQRAALGIDREFLWVAAGRLTEAKDHPTMVRAFARLHATGSTSMLLIAGAGPLEQELRALIGSLGLARQVRLLGMRTDLPSILCAADAFVMSSAWEGLPVVLLEAGASALPIVATDVSGTRDVVLDDVSGFVVPPRDPAALASAMARL
jgi:glycosyltransferase involved in cell wall biosynthesis